jgi:hypothetical protein
MATITPESTAPDGGLRLADVDPEVEHYASASDRFVVKFTFKGTDLLQLQNVLAPRLAGVGVGRSTRIGMTMSFYGVEHGREDEVFTLVQEAVDEVNRSRQAARENEEHERSAVEAAAILSEAQLEAVRESFRTCRVSPTSPVRR